MTRPTLTRTASPLQPGDWAADPAACTLTFAVRNFGLRTVTGQIPLTSAIVHVGPGGQPERARAKLDPKGIDTGNQHRDKDLRGRRFLATDQWPAITFQANHIQPSETGWTVNGTLTVKDTRCPVRLEVPSPAAPAGAGHVDLYATGHIDRRLAGVTAGPAFLIGHQISLSLTTRLLPPAGATPGTGAG
jgi:polyisoprenoid-binding protein YceI